MVAVPAAVLRDEGDQRLVLRGVAWKTYVLLNDAFDEPGVRMAYCEGELEIMTIGPKHELWKTMIARLLELYAVEHEVPLHGYGSTTLRNEMKERGLEPDECYCYDHPFVDVPELAIEVVVSHGDLDKLRIYEGLGVLEVWRFEKQEFTLYRLQAGHYQRARKSRLAPGLDFEAMAKLVLREDQPRAMREWRDWLRSHPPKARRRR